ncbi:hypothetical protein [Halobacterium noricense]|uniref:hypothetical protein n=1 Tax=Halobacterium noricense TaxID=223182 RepID=UPI001E4E9DFF|nr:hypothetical protein [Halobacterium noricense]UHH24516.1 hypothetical protein LT974_11035 [Halobacterium noricense]
MDSKRILLVVLVLALTAVPPATALPTEQSESPCGGTKEYKVVDREERFNLHIIYLVGFLEEDNRVCVEVKNKGEIEYPGEFGLWVDGDGFSPEMPDLESGESKSVSRDVTKYLDTTQDNHSVRVVVSGQRFTFNFTHHLNASSPEIPTPYVSDVRVVRSSDSTELVSTVHNPGERAYALHVRTETFETDNEFEIGAPQPGNSSDFKFKLDEDPDDVIAGKVMVYNDTGQPEGKFDQKEFIAKPNETANAWDDHFEQVPGGTVESDYNNETARQYREGYVDDEALSPLERRAGAALIVLTLIGAVLWRRAA